MSLNQTLSLRSPRLTDGMAVNRLVGRCPPLDPNSSYCNFLQCSHFSQTSVAAESDGELLGFISAYLLPEHSETLFVWQLAVDPRARGQGLASRMLEHILQRQICRKVNYIETTITDANGASWALFQSLAKKLSANLRSDPWLDREQHFDGMHDSEQLVRVGPLNV